MRPDAARPRVASVSGMGTFDRIVVGVDASDFGFEALQQSLVLRAPHGVLHAVTALDEAPASHAGFLAGDAAAAVSRDAEQASAKAADLLADQPYCTARIVRGGSTAVLTDAVANESATLVALGGRHRSRTAGLLLSGVATVVLHDAPCSVLFAHPRWGESWYPQRIVVGVDGSTHSLAALAVADEIAERLGSSIRVVAATGGKRLAVGEPWSERVGDWQSGDPVVELVDASVFADLVVVGSRGLHGLRSLGSVSERVAHRAHSSVLVVRGPAPDDDRADTVAPE